MLVVAVASLGVAASAHAFKANLIGKEDAVKTKARGEAIFKLEKDGTELAYDLRVKGIENVIAAHIHYGKKGEEGEPVANLFTGPRKEGKFSGDLVKGVITEKDLYGKLQGKTIKDVVKMIKAGELYVNVHTDKHPDGEIRGEIRS
jgi:hypothetical protein